MIFLKLLLSIIYIIIMAMASSIDDEEFKIKQIKIDEEPEIVRSVLNNKSSNIPDYEIPLYYNMKLTLNSKYVVSECIITIYISYAKKNISFYVSDSTIITKVILKKNESIIYTTNYEETVFINHDDNNIFMLDFDDVLLRGMYDLYIHFLIPINIVRESFGTPYINEDGEKEWLIATGIQRRNWYQPKKHQIFPYWNEPKSRIIFLISIIHNSKNIALSNMPIRETKLTSDNMTCTFFGETASMSIDSAVFLVSGFHQTILSVDDTIIQSLWFRPQSKSYLQFAKTVILYASEYMRDWNILRKVLEQTSVSLESKVDHVAIPDLQDEIKQTFGFIFYREADITYNEELDLVACKTIIARLIARGMIQKYINNLLKPTSLWPHAWLNEGFNVFYQAYIIDKALPNSRMMDLFVVQVQHELLYLNTYVAIKSVVEHNNYPENYLHSFLNHMKETLEINSLCGKSIVTLSTISFDGAILSLQAFKCFKQDVISVLLRENK